MIISFKDRLGGVIYRPRRLETVFLCFTNFLLQIITTHKLRLRYEIKYDDV